MHRQPLRSTLFPYTRSSDLHRADRPFDEHQDVAARDQHGAPEVLLEARAEHEAEQDRRRVEAEPQQHVAEDADRQHLDRKSTRLNSSHSSISYAVFCLKKKI